MLIQLTQIHIIHKTTAILQNNWKNKTVRDTWGDRRNESVTGWAGSSCLICLCLLVAVAVESWSWIASVFTRPLNKAFLSVFLVFVILVWLSLFIFFFWFYIFCLIVYSSTSFSGKIFGLNVSSSSSYYPSSSFKPAAFRKMTFKKG